MYSPDLVANAADRLDQIAALPKLLAQGADMNIHCAVLPVEGVAPNRI